MVGSLPLVSGSLSSVSSDLLPRKRLPTTRRPTVWLSGFIGPLIKASLMASSDNASGNWVEELPAVLLGLRSTVKEGLRTSAAEAVYGEPLRLPGSLVSTPTDPPSPALSMMSAVMLMDRRSNQPPATDPRGFLAVSRLSETPPTSLSARIKFALL